MDVCIITNRSSVNNALKFIANQWFCSAGECFVMVLLWGTVGVV